MTHKLIVPIIILSLLAMMLSISCGDSGKDFADPNLEAAVREAIQKPTGDIQSDDLKGLGALVAGSKEISDLKGLEHCSDLTILQLTLNEINDLSPLSELENLERLMLAYNKVSDVSPLSSLASLNVLILSENEISDISPLSGLTGLTELNLYNNKITDISPLLANSGLGEGDTIDLTGNPLSTTSLNDYIPQLEQKGVTVLR